MILHVWSCLLSSVEFCLVASSGCLAPYEKVAASVWISVDLRLCPSLSGCSSKSLTDRSLQCFHMKSDQRVLNGSSSDQLTMPPSPLQLLEPRHSLHRRHSSPLFTSLSGGRHLFAIQAAPLASRNRRPSGDGGRAEGEKKTIKEIPSY